MLVAAADADASTSCRATRSGAATRGTARSSAACTTTWSSCPSGCTCATPTATSACSDGALFVDHPLQSQTGVICVELVRRFEVAGAAFVEVPVHHYFRPHGRSQFFRLPHIARAALQLSRLWIELMVRHRT